LTRDIEVATPGHIAQLLAALAEPQPDDEVFAPAAGARAALAPPGAAGGAPPRGAFTLVMAAAPFAGTVERASVARDVLRLAKTRRCELLFVALVTLLLKPGGRAALVVPESVSSATSKAHVAVRRLLVEQHDLQAVIALPAGAFKPGASTASAILFFRKPEHGATQFVWFYDVRADGWSLDARRRPLLPADKLGPTPEVALRADEQARNNLPDVLARWPQRAAAERDRTRAAQSFCVPAADIAAAAFRLDVRHYQRAEAAAPARAHEILARLAGLEAEILQGIRDLAGMLKPVD
jgi:type I restriction enzyme M protein